MAVEQLIPKLSPTMTEGTIVAWKVKTGDKVKVGQVMAEVQTDKAVIEWECIDPGVVAEILIPAGTAALVNMVAAVFAEKAGEDVSAVIKAAKEKNAKAGAGDATPAVSSAAVAAPVAPAPVAPAPVAAPSAAAPKTSFTVATNGGKVRVSPVASRLAAGNRLDLSQLKGSGPDGRIIKRDIEKALAEGQAKIGAAAPAAKSAPKLKPFRADRPAQTVALSPMRKIIGQRLHASKTQIPHFQITEKVDCANLSTLREQANQVDGVRVSVNDLIVRAVALALRIHPKLNATFDGTAITLHDSADISVAVAIPDGLITPILFKAHSLSVRQIGEQIKVLAKKATDGKLQPAEFQGGSFTISNLGMYGIEQFNAIINPPQAAILAVGGIKDEPVVKGGQVVAGKTMRLTLSADHRVVDGADGAEFMKTLRELLEAPAALLI